MTLTEQWKKGELPFGEYWCKVVGSPYIEQVMSDCMTEEDIIEILAHVPSYKEAQRLRKIDNTIKIFSRKIETNRKEIARLKELLKECMDELKDFNNSSYPTVENLLTRVNAAIGESEE